MKHIPKA
jgi:hypothetical protein